MVSFYLKYQKVHVSRQILCCRGEMFGEGGYIRLRRDDTAKCGIDNTPEIGLKCKGDGFSENYVCGQCGLLFAPSYPIGAMTSAHISPPY